ncbi:hypothetical protein Gromo_00063 [Candidatus Gromoviella agglomerans]|nr:hypothetical protein Gromo_00063 [Candidatus Gromoviella agglomerans]
MGYSSVIKYEMAYIAPVYSKTQPHILQILFSSQTVFGNYHRSFSESCGDLSYHNNSVIKNAFHDHNLLKMLLQICSQI